MFASQLSRILQALPADVNYDTGFDSTEEKKNMKENQTEIICISNGKEADVFSFGKKGMLGSNGGFVADSDNLADGTRDRDEFSKVPDLLVDCSIESIENKSEGLEKKDDQNGLFHFIAQKKTGEEDTLASDTKDSNRYNPEFESYVIVNSTDHKDQCVLCGAVSASDVSHLCTDKSVIQQELPKLIVCCQESNYYPVRDICADKGLPAVDKVSVGCQKDDHVGTCVSLRCDGDKNNDTRDGTDSEELLLGDRSTVQDAVSRDANECSHKEWKDTKLHNDHDCRKLSSINKHAAANDTFLEDLVKLFGSKCSTNEKEENLAGHTASSTRDESIAVDVVEPESEACEKEGNPDKILAMPASQVKFSSSVMCTDSGCACSPELQDVGISEDKAKVNHSITTSQESDQYGDGEASFSGLGSVTYSGLIPYSGSISLRSDSSTTSTRSFAFPILQSEWNSSPVKMRKSDRRLQKHRGGWRQGLLCCRF